MKLPVGPTKPPRESIHARNVSALLCCLTSKKNPDHSVSGTPGLITWPRCCVFLHSVSSYLTRISTQCFFFFLFPNHIFCRCAWCKVSWAGLESVWCDQSVSCSLPQALQRLACHRRPLLHSGPCTQAALHHGCRLHRTLTKCVSESVYLRRLPSRTSHCQTFPSLVFTGNCGVETSSQIRSSSALLFLSRSLNGAL